MNEVVATEGNGPPVRVSSQDQLLALIRKKYPEYHPVVAMVQIAHTTEDEQLEFHCHKEVAKYTTVVDKQVEVKQETVKTRRVVVEMFGGAQSANTQPVVPGTRPHVLENNPSPVLGDVTVQDAAVVRSTVRERGPVEDMESAAQLHPVHPVLSAFLDVSSEMREETTQTRSQT